MIRHSLFPNPGASTDKVDPEHVRKNAHRLGNALVRELESRRLIPSQMLSFRGSAAEGRQNEYQAFLTEKGLKLQQLVTLAELGFEPLNNVDAGQLTSALPSLDDISESSESSEKQRETSCRSRNKRE